MKRRIFFVIDSMYPLGDLLQLRPLLTSLINENFEIHLAAPTKRGLAELPIDPSIRWHRLPPVNRTANQIVSLRQLIFRIQPEIVHSWGHRTHAMTLVAAFKHHRSRKVFSFFEKPDSIGPIRFGIEKYLRSGSIQLVVSHESTKRPLQELGYKEPIGVIPNSIPGATFDRISAKQRLLQQIGKGQQIFIAGTVARFDPMYRLKDLVWAIDLLCCVRRDIHLVVFGSGDNSALRRFISKTESANNIHLIPLDLANPTDLAGLDFYWNSHLQIPMPSPMLAAMSNGIPTISVLGPETADAIIPLRSALATNFGARDEFARWTKYLLEQPKSERQIATQGKQHVENVFPTDQMVRGYLELYAAP